MTMPLQEAAFLREENALLRETIKTLQAQIVHLIQCNEQLTQDYAQLKQDNAVLRLKVDAMARKLFGQSSEKLDPQQLQLVFDALQNGGTQEAAKKPEDCGLNADNSEADEAGEATASLVTTKPTKRKKRSLEALIASLPVTDVIIEPEAVEADPTAWRRMGEEVTKLINYTPGKFNCERITRPKYVRIDAAHEAPIIAPRTTLQERCIATPKLIAHTLSNRFELHLPYYRIEQMYARQGMPIPRQTLCGWTGMAHDASTLIMKAIKREVFADGYVQIDESPIKYQDPERQGTCGTGYLWVVYNPVRNISYMEWHTGRSTACLESLVPADYTGIIQCDGYTVYTTFLKSATRSPQSIILAGCLAHARRKFFEAKAEGEDPQWVLLQIQKLYHIEAQLREARASPIEVRARRQEQSALILDRIKTKLQELQQSRLHRPRSLTGEAISYTLNQWEKLTVYLRDGRVQIDNNLVENSIRPSAIGKKNWLFMGDLQSGARAATFYTLISNCHRQKINAEAYLTDMLTRLASATTKTVQQLTPHAWAKEKAAAPSAKKPEPQAAPT
jgi:transposase